MTNIKTIFDIQIMLRHPKKPSILYPITEVLSNLEKGNTVTGIAHWFLRNLDINGLFLRPNDLSNIFDITNNFETP